MITTILWDVDGTLLNFLAAEKAAIQMLFREFQLGECTDEMIARYSAINRRYWEKLERGEITKAQVLIGRFQEFFISEGLDASVAESFNEIYQIRLGDTIVFCDESDRILSSLKNNFRQFAVSNGTVKAQTRKLQRSGLEKVFDEIFLSEQIGAEKPSPLFFEKVLESIGPVNKEEILIVGDSLTSDMKGGNNIGIKTCWYNPGHIVNKTDVHVDWEIEDLHEIYRILETEKINKRQKK